MKCAVHPEVDATGFCRNCGKAMCADCARPVRDVLYCENCLATGMGVAPPMPPPAAATDPYSQPAYSQQGYVPPAAVPPPQIGSGRGAVAFVLGMFPGLGAVYNGEYNKALIHIVVFAAMIFGLASDDVSDSAKAFLGILLGGFVLYMAFDSMRVAQAKATGQPNDDPLNNLSKNLPLGPILLIGIGVLFLLSNFRIFDYLHISLGRLWPLFLIGAGVLMFRKRVGGS